MGQKDSDLNRGQFKEFEKKKPLKKKTFKD